MNNERIVAIINDLVDMKDERNYGQEKSWCELYEECIKELRNTIRRKHYSFDINYSQEDFEQDVMLAVYKKIG